jgi:hypothetical protein
MGNGDLGKMRKEAAISYFKALPKICPVGKLTSHHESGALTFQV